MRAKSNTTFALVSFYSFEHGRIDAYDPSSLKGPVINVDTNKRLGQPVGTFNVRMKAQVSTGSHAGEYWGNLLDEGDWVTIDVFKNNLERNLMMGRIDTISVSVVAGATGEPNVTVTITGRDVGGPISDMPIYFNPYDSEHDNASGLDLQVITGIVGLSRADELITKTIKGLMGRDGLFGAHVRMPDSLSGGSDRYWVDLLDLSSAVSSTLRGKAVPQMIASEGAPSIWSFLDGWRNPTFNEMWIDTPATIGELRQFYLFVRERPFVNEFDGNDSPWFSLFERKVDAAYIRQMNLVKGQNRANHIMLTAELVYMKDSYGIYRPVVNSDSIDVRGMKRIEENTRFFSEFGGDTGGMSEYRKWLDLLVSWNCLNHKYWSGTVDIGELRGDIKVGQKLVVLNGPPGGYSMFPADGGSSSLAMTFYVEGVKHTWSEGTRPQAQTSLMVSRGYVENQRVDDVRAEYLNFDNIYMDPVGSDEDFVYGLNDDAIIDDSEDGGIV